MQQAVGYIRVSREEQATEGVSLEAQEARIRAYAALAGVTITQVIRDAGISASVPLVKRPGGEQLVKVIAGKTVRHVIAVRLDRLFRSATDCMSTVERWTKIGVNLHLVDLQGAAVDTSSAMGKFFLNVMAAVAEMERSLISERTVAAMAHQKAQRRAYARTPYGFDRQEKALLANADEQKVIRQIQRWRRQGHALQWIADALTRRGVPTKRGGRWHPCTVSYLLKNTLYSEEVA